MIYQPLTTGNPQVDAELRRLAEILQEQDMLLLVKMAVAPAKPRDGMICYADGVNWNPGGGTGIYSRVGGAWVKL